MAQWIFPLTCILLMKYSIIVESRFILNNEQINSRSSFYPYNPYQNHRAMMFTGYYRPVRRSEIGNQASGIYAQGNDVRGETYFANGPRLRNGPDPTNDSEPPFAPTSPEESPLHLPGGNNTQQEDPIANTELPAVVKPNHGKIPLKKPQKHPIEKEETEEEEDEEADYEEDDVIKGNRRRPYYPNLNNFFPMFFGYPSGGSTRSGDGPPPDAITAIANSYSTSKGGVASSVATVYGSAAPPNNSKKLRA